MRRIAAIALPALLVGTSASAAPLSAHLSPDGLDWIEAELPSFVPTHLEPPPMTFEVYSCPGDNAMFTQQNTSIDLWIDAFDLSLPDPGTVRVDLTFGAWATGQAYFTDIYACFGTETCDDEVSIQNARVIADFTLSVDAWGEPHADLAYLDLQLATDDIYIAAYNCPPDFIINWLIDMAREWALQAALDMGEDMAQAYVGPKIEEILRGFTSYQGQAGSADFEAHLTSIDLETSGISIGADLDFSSQYPAAACVSSSDPGEPPAHGGAMPDLAGGVDAHVGVAVNLGVVDDALYHVWREGFMCVTPEVLAAFGIQLDLSHIGDLLPAFPQGTTFSLNAMLATPPAVEASSSDAAKLTLRLQDFNVDLIATLPEGTTQTLHAEIDASVTAAVLLDPAVNSLSAEMEAVTIDRLEIVDEVGLEDLGFDFARIQQLLEDRVLPKLMEELGRVPMTGPVFGGIADTYAILREVRTTDSYLIAKADLFRAPAYDPTAPNTFIAEAPDRVVTPRDAAVMLGGNDAEIPSELLKYRVSIDGVEAAPTYVRQVKVGRDGATKTYRVEARAIDLAGNEDATPATVDVTVDGVIPEVRVETLLKGEIDTATPELTWSAEDDLSPPSAIGGRIKIFDITDYGSPSEHDAFDFEPGDTQTVLDLRPGREYRLVITVKDEAGNEGSEALVFSVSPDAKTAGGCSVAKQGAGGTAPLFLLAGLVLVLVTVRRRGAR